MKSTLVMFYSFFIPIYCLYTGIKGYTYTTNRNTGRKEKENLESLKRIQGEAKQGSHEKENSASKN